MTKPKIPSGTRDFGVEEIAKRKYITSIIAQVFERNAYQPLETPAFEQLTTLIGKYGDEGDKLIFKILNNGLNEKNESKKEAIRADFDMLMAEGTSSDKITELALKYGLTIPFARYVVMNANTLIFPFKRYQMQPVWRADRPQKGRYREFWQCDADVVGVKSLTYDAELIIIYDDVFERLALRDTQVCINNRKILTGLAHYVGMQSELTAFTVILDKLDKIGWDSVCEQLITKGADAEKLEHLIKLMEQESDSQQVLDTLSELEAGDSMTQGITEMKQVIESIQALKPQSYTQVKLDISLARGLDYYTGMIVEVKNSNASGSIGGGGRYDQLTAIFGLKDMPGVGISFGLDRIYNLMEELELFPSDVTPAADLYVYASEPSADCLESVEIWRREGLIVEALYEKTKIDKVYKKAEVLGVKYVCIWDEETTSAAVSYKNIINGQRYTVDRDAIVANIKK